MHEKIKIAGPRLRKPAGGSGGGSSPPRLSFSPTVAKFTPVVPETNGRLPYFCMFLQLVSEISKPGVKIMGVTEHEVNPEKL